MTEKAISREVALHVRTSRKQLNVPVQEAIIEGSVWYEVDFVVDA